MMARRPLREPSIEDYLHLRVFTIARVQIGSEWAARDVCSSYWRLYVNNRGGAWVSLRQGTYDVTPDRLHLIPAGVHFSCHNEAEVEHFFIHFDVLGLPPPLLQGVFDRPVGIASGPSWRGLYESLVGASGARFAAPAKPEPVILCRAKGLVYAALAQVLSELPAPKAELARRLALPAGAVAAAIQRIESSLGSPLSNDELAGLCHLSNDQFVRRFKEAVGMTPAQYILQRRVTTAAQQLLFTSDSIDQIAEDCGFANRFYFSRVFTRRMGRPPAEYRHAQRV